MSVLPCSFLLLLIFLLPVVCEAKHPPDEGTPDKPRLPPPVPLPAQRPRNRSEAASGHLTTEEGHQCTWQRSGRVLVNLLVNCSNETPGAQHRYWCRYAGKPDLCQAYAVKSSQYWKQLVGKVKKRSNACKGEKVLKAKVCKGAAPEAHMKLAQRSREEERKRGNKGGETVGERERRSQEEEGVAQSYCSEGWNSLCSFIVNIFEG
ncbi:fibroblast growth factor-binding protein 1 [Brachionichthys hirsutus]|uniref:fibroblast growth factor-binding protein 1 n=1 Tax=Brachionichthys hirsutus TaxID=412623 RepID=UPI003604CA56